MPYSSLADFLEELAAAGELARVAAEVDPVLELAEITRRVAAERGPALLFERMRGQSLAVVANLLGTESRVCRALAIDSLDDIATRIETLVEQHTPQNWFDRLKTSADEAGANKFRAKTVKSGPCQQVVRLGRDVDLAGFPLVKQWPDESGPAITAGLLVTAADAAERPSFSVCPLQQVDQNRLAVADDGHSAFARHWNQARAAGEKMMAAVVLGGDPAALVAASLESADDAIDAYHLLGLARGKPLDLVKCRTHTLEVPADADLVIEGYLDPESPPLAIQVAAAGGNRYRACPAAPLLHVTAITHRRNPLFPVLIDAPAAGEGVALAKARERLLLPALESLSPDIVDVHLPAHGGRASLGAGFDSQALSVSRPADRRGAVGLSLARLDEVRGAGRSARRRPRPAGRAGRDGRQRLAGPRRHRIRRPGASLGSRSIPRRARPPPGLRRHLEIAGRTRRPVARPASGQRRNPAIGQCAWGEYRIDLGKK